MNTPELTLQELDRLELLDKEASKGPWTCPIDLLNHGSHLIYSPSDGWVVGKTVTPSKSKENASLICEIRTHLRALLSLARLQIESQGVTGKPGGSSTTSAACAPPAHSDVVPSWRPMRKGEILEKGEEEFYHGEWVPIQSMLWGDELRNLHWKVRTQRPPIHAEESPSDSELLTAVEENGWEIICTEQNYGDDAECVFNVVEHYMNKPNEIIGRGTSLRSAIKAAMEQEK